MHLPRHRIRGGVGRARARWKAGALVAAWLAFPALPVGAAPAASAEKKEVNLSPPGFTENLDGWRQERPGDLLHGTVTRIANTAAPGQAYARLESPSGEAVAGLTCDPIPLPKGGASLLLRIDYRTEGVPDLAQARVRPLDDKGQELVPWQSHLVTLVPLPPSEEWTTLSRAVMVVPEAAAYDVTLWVRGRGVLCVAGVSARVLRPEEYQVPSLGARIRGAGGNSATVWYESPLKKVYRDAKAPKAEVEGISLSAAAGECEPFQLVLLPKEDATGVRVRWEDLLGPEVLRREQGSAAWVEYVNLTRARSPLGRTGWTPDPLLPDDRRDLKGGQAQPIWLSLTIPRDAVPGLYKGSLRIEAEKRDGFFYTPTLPAIRVPVQVRVRGFALPDEPALTSLARPGKVPATGRNAFRRNLREHRVFGEAALTPPLLEVTPEGEVSLDFAAFDADAEAAFTEGLRPFLVPGILIGDANGLLAPDGRWHGLAIFSPEFERAYSGAVRRLADHLRKRGWLRDALFQVWDEPRTEESRAACRRLSEMVRAAAPDARLYLTGAPHRSLEGCADVWGVPFPDGLAPLRGAGGPVPWARDSHLLPFDRESSSIDLRAFPWRLKRAGITGVDWIAGGGDPWTKPDPASASLLYANRTGDGALVDSIRWEALRDGVEDYDALTLLEQTHARARQTLVLQDARFAAAAWLERLIDLVVPTPAENTLDPRRLLLAREWVDTLIELFGGAPACVVRLEGEGEALRLEGATVPGAQVRTGNSDVPVDAAGRFSLRPREGRFEFEVSHEGKTNGLALAIPAEWLARETRP